MPLISLQHLTKYRNQINSIVNQFRLSIYTHFSIINTKCDMLIFFIYVGSLSVHHENMKISILPVCSRSSFHEWVRCFHACKRKARHTLPPTRVEKCEWVVGAQDETASPYASPLSASLCPSFSSSSSLSETAARLACDSTIGPPTHSTRASHPNTQMLLPIIYFVLDSYQIHRMQIYSIAHVHSAGPWWGGSPPPSHPPHHRRLCKNKYSVWQSRTAVMIRCFRSILGNKTWKCPFIKEAHSQVVFFKSFNTSFPLKNLSCCNSLPWNYCTDIVCCPFFDLHCHDAWCNHIFVVHCVLFLFLDTWKNPPPSPSIQRFSFISSSNLMHMVCLTTSATESQPCPLVPVLTNHHPLVFLSYCSSHVVGCYS